MTRLPNDCSPSCGRRCATVLDDASLFEGTDAAQWREIYDLSSVQGVLAQAWDGMQLLP